MAEFLEERERYELEVVARRIELPTLKAAPYTASIDRSLLKSLIFMGQFDDIVEDASIETLASEEIRKFILSRVEEPAGGYDPSTITQALVGFKMPVDINDVPARIMTFCADFFERLDAIGCGDFKIDNPKKTVDLLLSLVEPYVLRAELKRRIGFDPSLEKDVNKFIKVLTQDAVA